MNIKKNTIPRGYRLKASTHKLIKKIQEELNSSQDKVIARAMKLFYETIKSANGNNFINKVLKTLVISISISSAILSQFRRGI
jgi:type IV secretory pathway VirB6-like protein